MFETKINQLKNLIDQELVNIYPNGPSLLREPINYIISGGKRLRPILCLLICETFDYSIKKAVIPSLSIELLHIFSLIHDDVMDKDQYRHNQLTIHQKWNTSVAILSGDAILALAFKRLNKTSNNIKELFNSALIAVCEGQALDIEFENLKNISEKKYLEMINLKTGHMLGLSAELGGILSKLHEDEISKLRKYGSLLGKAFQIQDDILEVISNKEIMGKSLNSDLLLGKKTYPMILAKSKFKKDINYIKKVALNDNEKAHLLFKDLLIKEDVIKKCTKYVDEIFFEANSLIQPIDNNNNLFNFTKYLQDRQC